YSARVLGRTAGGATTRGDLRLSGAAQRKRSQVMNRNDTGEARRRTRTLHLDCARFVCVLCFGSLLPLVSRGTATASGDLPLSGGATAQALIRMATGEANSVEPRR